MTWDPGMEVLRMGSYQSLNVPSLDEIEEEKQYKFQFTAYCSSLSCTRVVKNINRLGTKKPGLDVKTLECPDCGHALYWVTEKIDG